MIKKILKENKEGATLGLDYVPRSFKKGYAVSITDNRLKDWEKLSEKELRSKVEELKGIANAMGLKEYFIGWWSSSTGEGCLDISLIVENKREAVKIGRLYKQEAIFSFSTMEALRV